jgi:hypothetical protein
MNIPGITWRGEPIDDTDILSMLPSDLAQILNEVNGFILHYGALHIRGASLTPDWHSLRAALNGPQAFHILYGRVHPTDIPFAQDLFGDQFLIRDKAIVRLSAETGEVELLADDLEEFFSRVREDTEGFLNVGLNHPIRPGELLLVYPPFCSRESAAGVSLKPLLANKVILFHADLARQLRDIHEGGKVKFRITD